MGLVSLCARACCMLDRLVCLFYLQIACCRQGLPGSVSLPQGLVRSDAFSWGPYRVLRPSGLSSLPPSPTLPQFPHPRPHFSCLLFFPCVLGEILSSFKFAHLVLATIHLASVQLFSNSF